MCGCPWYLALPIRHSIFQILNRHLVIQTGPELVAEEREETRKVGFDIADVSVDAAQRWRHQTNAVARSEIDFFR